VFSFFYHYDIKEKNLVGSFMGGSMNTEGFKRKLAAILSADVKGYSRLMGEDEEATIRSITAYREVMTTLILKHRGRVVDSTGDNLLAEFASVLDAVRCAVEIQEELKARNAELPGARKMEFRIGVNLGDVVEEGERIYGDGVNIAARVQSLAEGGGICISRTVHHHVKKKLALGYEHLGEHTVKNIAEPVGVYRVLMEPEAVLSGVSREKRFGGKNWWRAALAFVAVPGVIFGLAVLVVGTFFGARKASNYLSRVPEAIENRREVRAHGFAERLLEPNLQHAKQTLQHHLKKARTNIWIGSIYEANRKVQMLGINFLGPLHDTREQLIRLLNQGGELQILLLDMKSEVFRQREVLEGRRPSDGKISGRLRAESTAALEIIKDINMFKKAGSLEVRVHDQSPTFSMLVVDNKSMFYNVYPITKDPVDPADVTVSRGTEGVTMEFRDGGELFRQKVGEFNYLWDRARPIDLESD
jgi:class 3 adenylate cyclase